MWLRLIERCYIWVAIYLLGLVPLIKQMSFNLCLG
jgi:hypothetical protein